MNKINLTMNDIYKIHSLVKEHKEKYGDQSHNFTLIQSDSTGIGSILELHIPIDLKSKIVHEISGVENW